MNDSREEQRVLAETAERLALAPPQDILRWAVERYAPRIVLASGFGVQSIAQIHMLHEMKLLGQVTVFYLETSLLFAETHQTRQKLEKLYNFKSTPVTSDMTLDAQAEEFGPELWKTDPTLCCRIRKVEPLRQYLNDKAAWITGLRRSQSATRASIAVTQWDDTNRMAKVNPMATLDEETILSYLAVHEVPYSPLRDQGYRSVGCMPCTQKVSEGADERSGRWAGHGKTECGIHLDGKTVVQLDEQAVSRPDEEPISRADQPTKL